MACSTAGLSASTARPPGPALLGWHALSAAARVLHDFRQTAISPDMWHRAICARVFGMHVATEDGRPFHLRSSPALERRFDNDFKKRIQFRSIANARA